MAKRLADLTELPNVFEAAEVLGCGPRLVRQLMAEGVLESVRLSRYVRVKRASLEALVEHGTDVVTSKTKAARRRKTSNKGEKGTMKT